MNKYISKIKCLVDFNNQKRTFFVLLFLNLVNSLIEILSLSSILPLFYFINYEEKISSFYINNKLPFYIFIQSSTNILLLIFILLIIFVYFIKFIFVLYFNKFNFNFIKNIQFSITDKIYNNYMNKDLLYFTKVNSSDIIKNILYEPQIFSVNHLLPLVQLITENFVIIFLFISLLLINPFYTIFNLILVSISSLFIIKFSKSKIDYFGKLRVNNEGKRLKNLQESLNGLKEIRINQSQNFFKNIFSKLNLDVLNASEGLSFNQIIPRQFLELIIIISLCLGVLSMKYFNYTNATIISVLTLFGISTFRILPSINRVINFYQSIKFSMPSLEILFNCINDSKNNIQDNSGLSMPDHINNFSILNGSFSYDKKIIFSNLNLSIKKGEFIGILGSSGSGKTTLINIVLGLFNLSKGRFTINDIYYDDISNIGKLVGYVPQKAFVFDDSIKNNIAFAVKNDEINEDLVWEVLDKVQLGNTIRNLPSGINSRISESGMNFSGGQIQRISIARALYKKPQILIFDEATASLDDLTENKIIETILQLKNESIIIFITHNTDLITNFDRVFEVKNSNLFEK